MKRNSSSIDTIYKYINGSTEQLRIIDLNYGTSRYPDYVYGMYPKRGPVVLLNTLAVVDGLQGQTFIVREYKEVLPMDAMMNEEKYNIAGTHSRRYYPPHYHSFHIRRKDH